MLLSYPCWNVVQYCIEARAQCVAKGPLLTLQNPIQTGGTRANFQNSLIIEDNRYNQ